MLLSQQGQQFPQDRPIHDREQTDMIHSLNSQNCDKANYSSNQCSAMQSQTGNATFSNQQPVGLTSNPNIQRHVFRPNTYPSRPMTSKNDNGMNQSDNAHVLGYIAT